MNDVLHVTKLSAKLISCHKLTTDLHYLVLFNPTTYQFRDQGMKKAIGLPKEHNGLYLLVDPNRMHSTKSQIPLSLI